MSADDDQECDLMLEALQMHLETIRSRLVSLTEHFQSQADIPSIDPYPPRSTHPLTPDAASVRSTGDRRDSCTMDTRTQPDVRKKRGGLSRISDTSSQADTDIASRSGQRGHKPLSDQLADWQPLHAYYKHVHLEALQQHVKQQLQAQRRMDVKWEEKCRIRERRERRERLVLKPRAFRSDLRNDTSFLQHVHTSIFYKIVEMEHNMRMKGLLRSKGNHETFWNTMLSGDRKKSLSPPLLSPTSLNISPVKEEESYELTNTWAITGIQETCLLPPPADTMPLPQTTEDILSQIERAVESTKPPKMHSLTDLLYPDTFRVEEKSQVSDSAVMEVRLARDRMHTMLAHSKRHELEAQRFMERSEFVDFSSLFSNFCAQLDQLSSGHTPSRVKNVSITAKTSKIVPSLPPIPSSPKRKPVPSPLPPPSKASDDITEESTPSLTIATPSKHEHVPLCLSEVISCSLAVKRPTGRSTLWNPLFSID